MSIKLIFMFNDIQRFLENMGSRSDAQEKRFHQDVNEIETKYPGRWDISITVE